MSGSHLIRGSRVGSGPMGEADRGRSAPRIAVSYWCSQGHETTPSFALGSGDPVPEQWDCTSCGLPAGRDRDHPPAAVSAEPYKTHLAYVKERRSDADGEQLLAEALDALRARSGA